MNTEQKVTSLELSKKLKALPRMELWEHGYSRCTACKAVKPLDDFYEKKNPQWPCKRFSYRCRECLCEIDREQRPYRHFDRAKHHKEKIVHSIVQ